ncbi:MAG: transcription antitermination factor NusB [Bifidobacteriaceae bacterium]|nr:transcription antitermination factor NusB [Bifidobacteriaceae bacterium]
MARSTARKRALNTLYEADEKGEDFRSVLEQRLVLPGAQTPLPPYAVEIVRGVAEHRFHLNRVLNDHSSWSINRMAVVDRNILRIAAWEIIYNKEIPSGVAIDEALQLAKNLSDADSPAFIHAVLSAIADDPDVHPETEKNNDANAKNKGMESQNAADTTTTMGAKEPEAGSEPAVEENNGS